MRRLSHDGLRALIAHLQGEGKAVIGPTVRDHAIVEDELASVDDLPRGWTDAQGPGRYRLTREGDRTFEGYVVGPHSMKQRLFPSREVLYQAERRPDGKVGFARVPEAPRALAFLGVRACDLAAAAIQSQVFEGGHDEPRYRARREAATTIAVNCTVPGDLCFCASTKTGPRVTTGADLVLTEQQDGFLVEVASPRGEALLEALDTEPATDDDATELEVRMEAATRAMGRTVDLAGLPELLFGRLDHPRWKEVADRCLACGNCTSVCPTCFCSTTEETSSLDGSESTHARLWESCFASEHGAIHGANLRPRTEDRYRQWLTHKVGAWVSQFGTSGCVGCGRCIAWCPVGIDLTEEIAALREGDAPPVALPVAKAHAHADDDLVPRPAEVVRVTRETEDTVTLHVRVAGLDSFLPGQFCQLSLPAYGEVPISISGHEGDLLAHTVRGVGAISRALCALRPGDELGLRGPYGRPWPLEALAGRPVVIVAGGIGLAPLRGAIRAMLARPEDFPRVTLLYGARSPEDAIYGDERAHWMSHATLHLEETADHATPAWQGHVGVVTRLLDRRAVPEGSAAMICGPEIMMRYTVEALSKLGVAHADTWVTMERHMKCATGTCGRCQYGPYFVCKDGPVFSFDEIAPIFGKPGF